MILIYILCIFIVVVLGAWLLQYHLTVAYARYRRAFTAEASVRLGEFFLFLDPAQLWFLNLASCLGLMGLTWLVSGGIWISLVAGASALFAPQFAVSRFRRRRLRRFDEQLPDFLMALSGAMRAGAGIQAALRHIVGQSPAPLSQEFGLLLREQRMGVPFAQALAGLYKRIPTEGTGLVVSCLTVAAQSGGSLADTLEGVATTLLARLHLLGRIHALTSQGRLQAWVMSALPFCLALALYQLDPDSMASLWGTPGGWVVITAIAVLEATGIFFIRRIVNIQV